MPVESAGPLAPWQREILRLRTLMRLEALQETLGTATHPTGRREPATQARRDADEMRALEEALARNGADDLGVCSECGDAIDWPHLMARPYAVLCANCEKRLQRKTK